MFSLSSEHTSQYGNIGSRIMLDVDSLGLMDEANVFIRAINRASFG